MSEQDAVQSSTKQRRSHKTSTANQQNGKQAPAAQRPANDDIEAWKAYWKAQGQPWRTEPEIDTERLRAAAYYSSTTTFSFIARQLSFVCSVIVQIAAVTMLVFP